MVKDTYGEITQPIKVAAPTATIPYRPEYIAQKPAWGTPEYIEWWENAYPAERYGCPIPAKYANDYKIVEPK